MQNTKSAIITLLICLSILLSGCQSESSNPQSIVFSFFKENFILRNFDDSKEFTKGISKKKNIAEAKKIDNEIRKNSINQLVVFYRETSKKNSTDEKKYQLFISDYKQVIDFTLKKSFGSWKITKYKSEFFKDPEKMVEFINSYNWEETKINGENPK